MKNYVKISSTLIISIIIFISFGCTKEKKSEVMNEIITAENISTIVNKIKEDKTISKEDIDLFSNGLTRLSMFKDSLIGKSVSQIIELQKKEDYEISTRALLTSAIRAEINLSHTFKLLRIQPIDSAEQKTNVLYFNVKNNSKQNISNLQGYLNIVNEQNQIVKKFPLNIIKTLEAGQTVDLQSPPYKHDDNNQNDVLLRTSPGLRPLWQPILVEFENGKKLNLAQRQQ